MFVTLLLPLRFSVGPTKNFYFELIYRRRNETHGCSAKFMHNWKNWNKVQKIELCERRDKRQERAREWRSIIMQPVAVCFQVFTPIKRYKTKRSANEVRVFCFCIWRVRSTSASGRFGTNATVCGLVHHSVRLHHRNFARLDVVEQCGLLMRAVSPPVPVCSVIIAVM